MTSPAVAVATVNQQLQLGVETDRGTAVAANRRIDAFDIVFGPEVALENYRPTGRKYTGQQEVNQEWSSGALDGNMDYDACLYPASGVYGAADINPHGTSATAKDWEFDAVLTGNANPVTYTCEQGESTRARKYPYALFSKWGYKFDRKNATQSGELFSFPMQKGISLTSSPTVVDPVPMPASHINVYLDPTYADLGTTKIERFLSGEFSFENVYGPGWFVDRDAPSFVTHVDLVPKALFKLALQADDFGFDLMDTMREGSTWFLRVEAKGAVIDNTQLVDLGAPSAGTFTLTYKGQTTTAIAYNAAAANVQTALIALSTVGATDLTVTGSAGGPYTVHFANDLASDTTALTGSGAGLTGGTFLITQTQAYRQFVHDMAVKVGKPDKPSDQDGIYQIGYELPIVEDTAWGHSHMLTVTTLLTGL